ncbi:MAG TPA: hypothetical protein VHW09_24120 [Bryobacteraceae bacterium]|jgi:hypothetical protein|nr:hypothetical protein [Bryobacteraceae bacterium]
MRRATDHGATRRRVESAAKANAVPAVELRVAINPPPTGSKAYVLWVLATMARKAEGLPYSFQVLAEIKEKLGIMSSKKDFTGDEISQILDAADQYVADPKNRVDIMLEAAAHVSAPAGSKPLGLRRKGRLRKIF